MKYVNDVTIIHSYVSFLCCSWSNLRNNNYKSFTI